MASIYDVDPNELIGKASEELKKVEEIKAPEWATFVKTGMHKERPPAKQDWWYARTASVLRAVYKLGPIGVSKLRTKYGGKKSRGFKTEHFYKGSGNIVRKVLQQLEKAGFVKQEAKGVHKGRVATGKGISFLDKIATQIYKVSKPKEVKAEVKEEKKPEVKPKAEEKTETKVEAKVEKKPEVKVEKKEAKHPETKKETIKEKKQ
jgi:small subunit ribosomal protein S19e